MDYIIYGAGFFGLHLAELLVESGIRPRCLFDRDVTKQGRHWLGVPVQAPDRKLSEGARILVANASAKVCESIRSDLLVRGFRDVETIYAFANQPRNAGIFSTEILPLRVNLDEISQAGEQISAAGTSFADRQSQETFYSIIDALKSRSFLGVPAQPLEKQYLLPQVSYRKDEIFCDIGAGPAGEFLRTVRESELEFQAFHLMDPCASLVKAFGNAQDERICYMKKAVGSKCGTVHIRNYWDMNACVVLDGGDEDEEVGMISLDKVPFSIPPSFFKIDVEGMEWEVLCGMKNMLEENRPIVAVACYHKISDFWKMPLYFSQMPRTRLFLRSYLGVHETVLYVVPEERLQ